MARPPVLLLVLTLLTLAGCADEPSGDTGAASTAGAETASSSLKQPKPAEPPELVLKSAAGRQDAVIGAFCLEDPSEGVGTCSDSPAVEPVELTVARPGDRLILRLEQARVVEGRILVHPLGCGERTTAAVPLRRAAGTPFAVDLAPGAYELDVFASFQAHGGQAGEMTGSLGLLVAGTNAPGIVPASEDLNVCREG